MARQKIGSVYASKDPGSSMYIKVDLYKTDTLTLKNGQYINVESKDFQLASIAKALEAGRLTEDQAEQAAARVSKMPDFILGELILNTK